MLVNFSNLEHQKSHRLKKSVNVLEDAEDV